MPCLEIVTPSLRSLARIADVKVRVAAAGARLSGGAAPVAEELDGLITHARAGEADARVALLACAQALAADDDERLAPRLAAEAEELRLPRAVHMLRSAPAHRAVRAKGRLREVCIPERATWCSMQYALVGFRLGYSESSDSANLATVTRRWVDAWEGAPAHAADDVYTDDDPAYRGHWVWEGVPRDPPLRAVMPHVFHVSPPSHHLMHPSPIAVRRLLGCARLRDVLVIASRRPSSPAIAREVARALKWSGRVEVRRALCMNPFTPTGIVPRFLPTLAAQVIADIARGPAHPLVREAARALLAA